MGMLINPYAFAAPAFPGTPDANTLFLCRFNTATPINEVGSVAGTLFDNAFCDTTNGELVLDGTNDYAQWAGGSTFYVSTNWTMECHTNVNSGNGFSFLGRGHATNGDDVAYYIPPATNNLQVWGSNWNGGGSPLLSASGVIDGSWHHWAFIRDGGTYRLHRDGIQVASAVNANKPADNSNNFNVGTGGYDPTGREILGRVARVKVSNIARWTGGTTFTPPSRTEA